MKERWTANFSSPKKSCFYIKPEISFNAYLEKGSLFLGLKKSNRTARVETVKRVYVDQLINARFRLDNAAERCAAGIQFRATDQEYYIALVSGNGEFRFDAVHNGISRPIIGWTDVPGFSERGTNLNIIIRGDHFIFILNGRWIAEANDGSVPGGRPGFVLASYEQDSPETPDSAENEADGYSCRAWLDFLSVDSRTAAVETEYQKWNNGREVTAESRLRLAKSFAALDCAGAAYSQILKAWKQREEAARSVTATYTEMRARGELILAARMAEKLGQYNVAEEYIGAYFSQDIAQGGEDEILEAFAEKAKLLNVMKKYDDLAAFLPSFIERAQASKDKAVSESLPVLYALLGVTRWNLKDYKAAAAAWDTAFNLDQKNGMYAANAANAYEQKGKKETALQRRISACKCFLQDKNYSEIAALTPGLSAAGKFHDSELDAALQAALQSSPDEKKLLDFAAVVKQARESFVQEKSSENAAPIPSAEITTETEAEPEKKTAAKKPAKTKAEKAAKKTAKTETEEKETAVKKPAKSKTEKAAKKKAKVKTEKTVKNSTETETEPKTKARVKRGQ